MLQCFSDLFIEPVHRSQDSALLFVLFLVLFLAVLPILVSVLLTILTLLLFGNLGFRHMITPRIMVLLTIIVTGYSVLVGFVPIQEIIYIGAN